MSKEEKESVEDKVGDCIELPADFAAVSPTELDYPQMDGDIPTTTKVEEDVTINPLLDAEMTTNVTTEWGEVNDEDNIVLQGALHHIEQVSHTGPFVHHMAFVSSSALTTTILPISRSSSSCTTPPRCLTPPPTAIKVSPGSHSNTSVPSQTDNTATTCR